MDISGLAQPPNSLDFNNLKLGFFSPLHSASQEHETNDVVKYFMKVFTDINLWVLNDVFLSLFKQMKVSMEVKGGNFYKEPHLSKAKQRNPGKEEVDIVCCDSNEYETAGAMVETGLDEKNTFIKKWVQWLGTEGYLGQYENQR